jgi:hypothetical protein
MLNKGALTPPPLQQRRYAALLTKRLVKQVKILKICGASKQVENHSSTLPFTAKILPQFSISRG